MKMKSIVALILALVMVLSIAACGNPQTENPTETPAPDSSNPTTSDKGSATDLVGDDLDTGIKQETIDWYRGPVTTYTTEDTGMAKKTPDGTLVIRMNMILAVDPNTYMDEHSWMYNVYEPLIQRDWETGELHPMLATDWGYNDDGSYHITIRDDVTFHSGNHMTAADVLYTFQRIANSPSNEVCSVMELIDFDKCVIEDDYNLTIAFKQATPVFETSLCTGFASIVDSKFIEEKGPDYDFLSGDAGSGAYYLVETVTGVSQTFKRFDDWWGGTPDFDTIIGKNYTDLTAMNIDYMNGDVDITMMNNPDSVSRVLSGETTDTTYYDVSINRGYALCLTTMGDQTPFSDKNVRMALAHCIDMEAVIFACYGNNYMGTPATSYFLPGTKYFLDTGAYEYNPELAMEYLAKSGYSVSNPVRCKAVVGDADVNSTALETIQAYASAVGIEIDITVTKSYGATKAYQATDVPAEYDMVLIPHHSFGTGDPSGGMTDRAAYGLPIGTFSGMQGVDNQQLSELFEASKTEMDEAKREALFHQMQELYHEEAWIVPLFWYNSAVFARNYLGNVHLTNGYSVYWADLTYEG